MKYVKITENAREWLTNLLINNKDVFLKKHYLELFAQIFGCLDFDKVEQMIDKKIKKTIYQVVCETPKEKFIYSNKTTYVLMNESMGIIYASITNNNSKDLYPSNWSVHCRYEALNAPKLSELPDVEYKPSNFIFQDKQFKQGVEIYYATDNGFILFPMDELFFKNTIGKIVGSYHYPNGGWHYEQTETNEIKITINSSTYMNWGRSCTSHLSKGNLNLKSLRFEVEYMGEQGTEYTSRG